MLTLTNRDRDILNVLTQRVRLLTVEQIGRTWWNGLRADDCAARRLKKLEREGLLQSFIAYAHPMLDLHQPVCAWSPGMQPPNFGAVSYQLVRRWTESHIPMRAVIATRAAGSALGGYGGKRPKRVESNHDVHLAAVYLLFKKSNPSVAATWRSEEVIRNSRKDAPGERLPDALVRTNDTDRIIDFGGSYSPEKIEGFHRWAARKAIGYELW